MEPYLYTWTINQLNTVNWFWSGIERKQKVRFESQKE